MRSTTGFVSAALCLWACGHSSVTEVSRAQAAVDTAYAIQGEYQGVNAANGNVWAAQVSARGGGNFRLLLLKGGLPGQGWNGQAGRILTGTLNGAAATFIQNGFNLSIAAAGDSMRGTNDSGQRLGLAKVHRQSPTLNQAPPTGATVLFDGTSLAAWTNASARLDSNRFLIPQGSFSTGGAVTTQSFGDFTLHLEFQLPFEPDASGQGRANSGVSIQNRYEVQILDSFGESFADLATTDSIEPTRQCGGVWEQSAALINMTFPPLTWQTYDIDFTAARWDSLGHKVQNARLTMRHNGVFIHSDRNIPGSTLQGAAESSANGPNRLQYHGHDIPFKNIWIVPHAASSKIAPAILKRQGSLHIQTKATRYALANPLLPFLLFPDGRILGLPGI